MLSKDEMVHLVEVVLDLHDREEITSDSAIKLLKDSRKEPIQYSMAGATGLNYNIDFNKGTITRKE